MKNWKYSRHYKNDAQGHIFSHGEDRMIANLVGVASQTQEGLDKDAEYIVEACNNYSEAIRLLQFLIEQLNDSTGDSQIDYFLQREIEEFLKQKGYE